MVVRIGFPVLFWVLIQDLPFGNDSYGLSDRVSRLASGINLGPVCFRSDFHLFWEKTKETLIEYG